MQFRVGGYTRPVLANRRLVLSVREGGFSGPMTDSERLGTVKTDRKGRFRSKRFRIDEPGTWVTSARPARPSRFAIEESCGPVFDYGPTKSGGRNMRPATVDVLDGRHYVSTSVKGKASNTPRKLNVEFFEHSSEGSDENLRPTMVASAGCNTMGAEYSTRGGRVRWISTIEGTVVGCRNNYDGWLIKQMKSGMKASVGGKWLLLKRPGITVWLRRAMPVFS